jgi:hypothetical protein
MVTVFGIRSIVPIHPVDNLDKLDDLDELDEYADLPIYERIQCLLIDLWIDQGFLLQE